MPIKVTEQNGGVRLMLKVVPGASRDRIVGVLGDALKIAVSKPPAEGAANKAVLELLADALNLPVGNVSIVRGQSNPRKEVVIIGVSASDLNARLAELIR
jgi:uncharacterized protein (TIGR00251 family)